MSALALSPHAKPAHRLAARMLLDTLTLGDVEPFVGLSVILRAKLSPPERRALAWAALRACDEDEALAVAEAVIPADARAGWPVVPLEDIVEEASFWADLASPEELRAYAGVCLARLPQPERVRGPGADQRRAA